MPCYLKFIIKSNSKYNKKKHILLTKDLVCDFCILYCLMPGSCYCIFFSIIVHCKYVKSDRRGKVYTSLSPMTLDYNSVYRKLRKKIKISCIFTVML